MIILKHSSVLNFQIFKRELSGPIYASKKGKLDSNLI